MAEARMSRRMRKILRQIHKSTTHFRLQEIASNIQSEVDSRNLTYDDALTLGNQIQAKADTIPGDTIVYAISDRDAYRKTLELYLKDGILTRTEQLLYIRYFCMRYQAGNTDHNQGRSQGFTPYFVNLCWRGIRLFGGQCLRE